MTFNWHEFLDICNYLKESDTVASIEARTRVIVSRAYYASLNHTRQYLEINKGFISNADYKDHQQIPDEIGKTDPFIKTLLKKMYNKRKCCDYRDDLQECYSKIYHKSKDLSGETESIIRDAQEIFRRLHTSN